MTIANAGRPLAFWRGVARLCRFDLHRFGVPIAIVAGLELLGAALTEWVHRDVLLPSGAFEFQVLDGPRWLATAVTTAMLVQAEHPADDRAFLRSRPIGPWSVAVAKATTLGFLTVLLPFAATAVRLAAYGASPDAMAASAVQFSVIGGAVVLPAWTLALATRTLPRFLAAAAGLAVAWSVSMAAVASLASSQWFAEETVDAVVNRAVRYTFAPPLTDWQRVDARGWLFALAMTLAAAAILVVYYRTRRAMSSAIAAAVLLAAPSVWSTAPASASSADEPVPSMTGALRLPALVIPSPTLVAQIGKSGGGPLLVFGDVLPPPLPSNVSTNRLLGRVRVTAPGLDVSADGLALVDHDAGRASAAAARSTEPVATPEPDSVMLFYLSRGDIESLRGRRVRVEAPVDVEFTRHVHVVDLPLRPGVAYRASPYLVEILAVDTQPGLSRVHCRFTRFPSLTRSHANVVAFIRQPDGRVVQASLGLRPAFDPDFPDERRVGWAHGRTWTRHVQLSTIEHLAAGPDPAHLRIVEAQPAGATRLRLDVRDVPVREREPRPPTSRPVSMSLTGRIE